MGGLSFRSSEQLRLSLTKQQQKAIEDLYKKIAKDIENELKTLPNTTSGALRRVYLNKLSKQIQTELKALSGKLESMVKENMEKVAEEVVKDNLSFLKSIGITIEGAFSHIPSEVVKVISTGQLYEGNWSLSSSIWGINNKTSHDINQIIAQGIAQNKSSYDIAKDLEKYVDPAARKDWDWSKVYPGTNKKVDYNAQRLARTMVSHAYQWSFVQTTKNNPFVEGYRWEASNSSRVCPLCASRDGRVFEKDKLPLDHPNGLCTFTAVMPDLVDVADRLADWALGKPDPAIDSYVQSMKGT